MTFTWTKMLLKLSLILVLFLFSLPIRAQQTKPTKPTLWLIPLEEPTMIDQESKRWDKIWEDVRGHLGAKKGTFTVVQSREEATILVGLLSHQPGDSSLYLIGSSLVEDNCTSLKGIIMIKGSRGPDGKPLHSIITAEDCTIWSSTAEGGTDFAKQVDKWVKDNREVLAAQDFGEITK